MRWTSKLVAAALAAFLQACATGPAIAPQPSALAEARAPVTILVSIDGFRPDYLERGVTPNLSRLAAEGASGPMWPSFPSKTFPNHWTLVTGLRPDRHGLVANKMKDASRPDETFTMSNDDPFWWGAASPIWLDAEHAGIRTGTQFWPGSNVALGGRKAKPSDWEVEGGERPSDWQQFNQAITPEQRINGILDWLRRPAAIRPRLLTLYFDAVDSVGHDFGPADARTIAAVATADKEIGHLVAGLAELGQPANLVIVSDHGMAATSSERVILIGDVVARDSIDLLEYGPYAALTPLPGKEAAVETALLRPHPHMQCWRKREIPARFHYGRNPRVPPILCLAETGWLINDKPASKPFTGGNHGYDNQSPDMAALFIAHGPAFRPTRLGPFEATDVYPLLRTLLKLPARSDLDGSDAPFAGALVR
ncbi:nucleotide pyrophosphatase/phosphodiesterase family protein [Sphingomonas sp. M1-B02]|uniref:nucleotide pyrophosphatase/phosphodiesterase family protein n=1 Tax=Sphingomonas sp. M1-B02 TaxID=3114300 RepID=UPI00223FCC36|nr:nucleotide pyrophosphatase/phosphodiesterase family protein [Sphingomonas sp. S6-11]UZK66041.1 alkaline phosphatase family protein [Sphingomonas sp. S6-11]